MLHVPDGRVLTDDWSLLIWAIIRSTLLRSGGGGEQTLFMDRKVFWYFSLVLAATTLWEPLGKNKIKKRVKYHYKFVIM